MPIDFEKIQNDVSEMRQMMQTLFDLINHPISSKQPSDELLTVGQAADLLNLTTATIYGYVYEKKIPFSKPPGSGRLYFVRSELIEWVRNGRKATDEELDEQARQQIANRIDRRNQSKQRKGEHILS